MQGRVKGFIYIFSAVIFIMMNFCFCPSAKAENVFRIKEIITDKAGKLIIINGSDGQKIDYQTSTLPEPDRFILDIENSVLLGTQGNLDVKNKRIKDLRFSQFSLNPDIVRFVLTVDSKEMLKKIKVSRNKKTIFINLEETITAKITKNPLYKDREPPKLSDKKPSAKTKPQKKETEIPEKAEEKPTNPKETDKEAIIKALQEKISHDFVLTKVKYSDNRIIISGIGVFSLTEPVLLENPDRIVFDIPGGVVGSPEVLKPAVLKNGDSVRIGQFDENTARIVVESKNAGSYKIIISPDMQSLLIAPENEISFEEFPDSTSTAELIDIKIIKKDAETTKVLLIFSNPVIHGIKHTKFPNKLTAEIYNLQKPPRELINRLPRTEQFHIISVKDIEKYGSGTTLVFPLNINTKIQTRLSLDGRMLEITVNNVALPATFPQIRGKVVIDPGHGGGDPGAMSGKICEKHITLDIAKRVKARLQQYGIKVIMTRETDKSVSLKERVRIANRINPNIFVSIHVNSSESSKIHGIETYMYSSGGKKLAKKIHAAMLKNISARDGGIRKAAFYVIRHTKAPAVLSEIGYLSNYSERCYLLTEKRKEATAKAISEGIANYLKSL